MLIFQISVLVFGCFAIWAYIRDGKRVKRTYPIWRAGEREFH